VSASNGVRLEFWFDLDIPGRQKIDLWRASEVSTQFSAFSRPFSGGRDSVSRISRREDVFQASHLSQKLH